MFWKKETCRVFVNGIQFNVEPLLGKFIEQLKEENHELKHELAVKSNELYRIKPILERNDFKPAISTDCANCKYVVKNTWNNDVLGCRKDNVCDDFSPKEEDTEIRGVV